MAAGAALGFLAVAIGAFGAHGLKERLAGFDTLAIYNTGVLYHLVHAPLVFMLGMRGTKSSILAAWLFTLGIVIFSGSLYILSVTNKRWLGAITPIGGLLLLAGWAVLGVQGMRGLL